MIGIGLRAAPKEIYYALASDEGESLKIKVSKLTLPVALDFPQQLAYVRSSFVDIIAENKVEMACIRITEPNAQKPNVTRISIEAVLQELLVGVNVRKFMCGTISIMSAKLQVKRKDMKPIIDGSLPFDKIPDMGKYTVVQREAIIAAFTSIQL